MKAIEHFKVNIRIGSGAGGGDTIQPASVPRYELRILRAIHNSANDDGEIMQMVTITGRELVPLPWDEETNRQSVFSARAALEKMKRVYGGRRNNKIVSKLFRTSKSLGRLVKLYDLPPETKAAVRIPKGMTAATLSKKLMAPVKPAKTIAKKKKKSINGHPLKTRKAEHRAAA